MSTSIVLVCAVLSCLAAGVLLAYGICHAVFAMFRMHAQRVGALRTGGAAHTASGIQAIQPVEG